MAKQIKRSEIAEKDLYRDIRSSAEKTITTVEGLNKELGDTADVLVRKLKKPLQITSEGIKEVTENSDKLNELMKQSLKLDKAKADALKAKADADKALAKLQKEKIKQTKKETSETEELSKAEKEIIKLKEKLNDLRSDEGKEIERLKDEIREKRKETKKSIQQDKAQEGSIEALRIQLSKTKKEYIALSREQRESAQGQELAESIKAQTDELKELEEQIGVTSRNVGNYKESVKEAIEEMGGFSAGLADNIDKSGALGQVIATLSGVKEMLSKVIDRNNDEVEENTVQTAVNEKTTKGATRAQRAWTIATYGTSKALKVLKKALISTGIGAVVVALGSIITAISKTQAGLDGLNGVMNKVSAVIQVTVGRLATFGKGIIDILQAIKAGLSGDFLEAADQMGSAIDRLTGAFVGIGAEYEKAIDNAEALTKAQKDQVNNTLELEESIARLTKQEELLQAVADDTTKSFKVREEASRQALEIGEKRAKQELELAEENLRVLDLEQKTRKEAGTITDDDKKQRLEVLKQVIDAEKNLLLTIKNNERTRDELRQDRLERDLDILLDGYDNQKTINERIINNEKFTWKTRQRLLDETIRQGNESFMAQKDVLEDLSNAGVDIDELLGLDAIELQKRIRQLEQSEIVEGRTLEVIRDRRTAINDLKEAQQELNEQKNDQLLMELELQKLQEGVRDEALQGSLQTKRIELLEEEISKKKALNEANKEAIEQGDKQALSTLEQELELARLKREEAEKERDLNNEISSARQNIEQEAFEFEIDMMQKRFDKANELGGESVKKLKQRLDEIKALRVEQLEDQAEFDRQQVENEVEDEELKAEKIREINQKLSQDLQLLNKETAKQKDELDEKETEKLEDLRSERVEDAMAIQQQLTDAFTQLADKRIAKIDEEIEASQRRFDNLQELAQQGNIVAKESMAEEARLMAEQNRKREQMERRKQQIELASSVLQTYSRNAEDENVANPLAKTIRDTVLLTEFIKTLPTFFEGTEDTGKQGEGVDGKGGFFSILHPNERVVPKKHNEMIGDVSNEELANLAYKYQAGLITDKADYSSAMVVNDNSVVVSLLESLERTIKNKPETNIELEQIISGAMVVKRTKTQGNTKIYNRYRV